MKNDNNIKSKAAKDSSLRGIGKLGWTESGKTISTQRRLAATFVDEDTPDRGKDKKYRQTTKCPSCGNKVTIKSGKYAAHKVSWFTRLWNWDISWCPKSNQVVNNE